MPKVSRKSEVTLHAFVALESQMNGSDQSRPKDSFSMVENTPNHSELIMLEASDAQKSFLNGMQEVN